MKGEEIANKFVRFFEKNKHKKIESSSLLPLDKTVLLTTAGMQQFILYFKGEISAEKDFKSRTLTSVQKCFRTSDIDDVGDETHLTFFEMLGNFSVGDYFKKEAIGYALDFLAGELGLDKKRIWVTVFKGNENIPGDLEAIELWKHYGIPEERIFRFGTKENFWGPPGTTGPCGPCSELHYDLTKKACVKGKKCGPNCDCGRFIEVWNLVFMEYEFTEKKEYVRLPSKNIDTGMGLERITMILQKKENIFETDLFNDIINHIRKINYKNTKQNLRFERIVADHLRGSVFLICDGVRPSNVEQGYILRRILRKSISYLNLLGGKGDEIIDLVEFIIDKYEGRYKELGKNKGEIIGVITEEKDKFQRSLDKGFIEIEKLIRETKNKKSKRLPTKEIFQLYDTYGFPVEITKELASKEKLDVDEEEFEELFKKHQEKSRAGVEKKFGGVGDFGEKVARHHTATHLLHQALREVLGKDVRQAGSDLTPERIRFDFMFNRALTEEEKKKVEDIINKKIKECLPVKKETKKFKDAQKEGFLAFFRDKYGEEVSTYSIGNFSKEVCAGPHVTNTKEIGRFKIVKEKSSASGIRRIKAILE
ncbi:MAG: alanine--tRNA ligase [Candidatus Nanoarchaeia archaeon]|nr:alanine--tRNA ligase [Candidatus Nanoarchaeia archaeon]